MISIDLVKCSGLVFWLGVGVSSFKFPQNMSDNKVDESLYSITSCYDGDTCTATHKENIIKLRLIGIDALEMRQKTPYALKAKEYLNKQVLTKQCRFKTHGKDVYGRHLAVIFCDEQNTNRELVLNGLAYAYPGLSGRGIKWAEDAELAARKRRVGIFFKNKETPPWVFRKQNQ